MKYTVEPYTLNGEDAGFAVMYTGSKGKKTIGMVPQERPGKPFNAWTKKEAEVKAAEAQAKLDQLMAS